MKYKIEAKKTELLELENELNNILAKGKGKLNDLFDWVAMTISLFREINLEDTFIKGFIDSFDINKERTRIGSGGTLLGSLKGFSTDIFYGPFYLRNDDEIQLRTRNPEQYLFKVRVAFAAAKQKVESLESEERLVPKTLTEFFGKDSKLSHIESSLKLLETCYQNKDTDGIYKNSLTLLDSIFELEPSLKEKGLQKKIRELQSNTKLMAKFGISREILCALDNNRLIRNWEVVHKTVPLKYNIPLQVSLGCAYLVITVLEITMATGKLIK